MRHVGERPVGAAGGPSGGLSAAPDDIAVITTLDPTSDAPPAVTSEVLRDYAQLGEVAPSTPRWLRRYTAAVVALDVLSALIAMTVALQVGLGGTDEIDPWMVAVFPFAWVAALALGRTYEHRYVGNGSEEYKRLFHASVITLAVVATFAFATTAKDANPPLKGVVLVALPLAMLLSLVSHWGARQTLHSLRGRGRCMQQVVVVGLERSVAELIRSIRREPHAGLNIAAVCIDRPRGDTVEGVPVMGDSDHVIDVLREVGADTVAVTSWSDVSQNDLRRLSWDLEGSGVTLLVAPRLTDISGPRIHIRPVAGLPLLNVEEPEFTGVRRIVKGAIDRALALFAIILLGPVLIAVSLAVAVTSRGPIMFRQVRIGRHGKPFIIHKFRSMYIDAEERLADLQDHNEADGELFKMRDDPRVTPVGRYLRRFSLDELPQFFDVLLGRMSLVGPRPPLPTEVDRYASLVRRRLVVKPGITGLWQVSGRSDLSWDESVRLDLLYVENWSLALDVVIMMKTVMAVLRRRGAY